MSTRNITGWNATLGQFLDWLATAEGLSDVQRANAQRIADHYTKHVVGQRNRVYDDGASHNQREQAAAERILSGLGDVLDDAIEQAKRGEITASDLLKVVTQVQRDSRRAVAMSEAAAEVEERAWEQAEMTPEAFQAAALARFPALRERLPRISDAVMEGREDLRF